MTNHTESVSAADTAPEGPAPTEETSSGLARRGFIKGGLGVAGFAATASIIAACGGDDESTPAAADGGDDAAADTTTTAATPSDTVAVTSHGPEI